MKKIIISKIINGPRKFGEYLKKFRIKHRLIDNAEGWIDKNISPFSLGYIKEGEKVRLVFYLEGEKTKSYWVYKWSKVESNNNINN